MPTKHPRVYVPVSDDLRAALEEFTKESGIAKSQILSQLLSETAPVIRAMTEAFRVAKKSPTAAVDRMRELAQEAHIAVAQLQLDMQAKPKLKKLRKSPKRD
ncbi:hypothetical protein [Salmonella enterica]|uniref:hypothetical protein n=1 Tax=Salmonella enterica TaxID=28901 RepID=UPI0032971B08